MVRDIRANNWSYRTDSLPFLSNNSSVLVPTVERPNLRGLVSLDEMEWWISISGYSDLSSSAQEVEVHEYRVITGPWFYGS